MALDPGLAARAIQAHVAEPLGLSLHEAARGILAIADSNMVGAIRVVSVERGHDPRDFTLVPFGGAGPLHGCALADLLGITHVLVPPAPGVLCAEGLLAAALKSEFSRTLPRPDEWDAADVVFAALEDAAQAWFETERVTQGERKSTRVALLRYQGQGAELAITWPGSVEAARTAFAAAHQALNGFTLDTAVELVTLRVEAEASAPPPVRPATPRGLGAEPIGRQIVHDSDGSIEALVYDRARLGAGDRFVGPAIVTQLDATTVVARGWQAEISASGALMLRRTGDRN